VLAVAYRLVAVSSLSVDLLALVSSPLEDSLVLASLVLSIPLALASSPSSF